MIGRRSKSPPPLRGRSIREADREGGSFRPGARQLPPSLTLPHKGGGNSPCIRRRAFLALMASAATWPLAARAQQTAMLVIGFLNAGSPTERADFVAAFLHGLEEEGFVEGKNIAVLYRWAEGRYDRLPTLAADLVNRNVAAIAAADAPSAMAAKAATTAIPIVFQTGADALQTGLVSHLDHPEANLTGINEIAGPLPAKRLGLLHELVPTATTVGLLINPQNDNAKYDAAIVREAAHAIGLKLILAEAATEGDLTAAFASLARDRVSALVVNTDVFLTGHRDLIVALAARYALPSIFPFREYAAAGGLMSYGVNLPSIYRQVGTYVGKILKGAKSAELPVIQPTKFDFVVNLKTAETLQLKFPPGLLAIADEVIE